jgi:TetR/AcrR family transcriptional repressor of nem operon
MSIDMIIICRDEFKVVNSWERVMKVSREQAEANREEVIEQSLKLFRARGFVGVGLNELMNAAGLTRGGFYGQFQSKQHLIKLALGGALESKQRGWETAVAEIEDHPLRSFVHRYLADTHRNRPETGCGMAALVGDVSREDTEIRTVFETGVKEFAGLIGTMMPGDTVAIRGERAVGCLAALVGALCLSRAVADRSLSRDICEATASMVLSALDKPATLKSKRPTIRKGTLGPHRKRTRGSRR